MRVKVKRAGEIHRRNFGDVAFVLRKRRSHDGFSRLVHGPRQTRRQFSFCALRRARNSRFMRTSTTTACGAKSRCMATCGVPVVAPVGLLARLDTGSGLSRGVGRWLWTMRPGATLLPLWPLGMQRARVGDRAPGLIYCSTGATHPPQSRGLRGPGWGVNFALRRGWWTGLVRARLGRTVLSLVSRRTITGFRGVNVSNTRIVNIHNYWGHPPNRFGGGNFHYANMRAPEWNHDGLRSAICRMEWRFCEPRCACVQPSARDFAEARTDGHGLELATPTR